MENGCDREWQRVNNVTPKLRMEVADMMYALDLRHATTLWLSDGSPDRSDLADGLHYWGKHKSLVVVLVWPEETMPNAALEWMIAHELRHVHQSIHDTFDGEPTNLPHDDIPSERDANDWASEFADFDGLAWWAEFVKGTRFDPQTNN